MVHFVRLVLAHRADRVGDIPLGLAIDTATAYFWHCRSWSFELSERSVLSSCEAASRATRHLEGHCLPIDYLEVNAGVSC